MANGTGITKKITNFNANNSLPLNTNQTGEELLATVWGLNQQKTNTVSNISKLYFTKHGMFASIPIICKDQNCAYKDVCMVDPSQRVFGSRCPMEIAALITRFNQWCQHFDINTDGEAIESKDLVDATLIKDLVNIEIQILRAENKIALSGDFMGETLLDIDKKCNPYYGNVITPESEFLMTLQDKKMKILNQLNATRKDKAADKRRVNASDEAVRIFQQMQELQKEQNKTKYDIMDVNFDENGVIIEENVTETTENNKNTVENYQENANFSDLPVENTENTQKDNDN